MTTEAIKTETNRKPGRRAQRFLTAAGALALLLSFGLQGCKKGAAASSSGTATGGGTNATAGATDKPLVVGFVYVGTKDDYGYNQAHADGAAEVKKIPGVKVIQAESIKETKDCQSTM